MNMSTSTRPTPPGAPGLDTEAAAEQVLAALQARGFEHAQVTVSESRRCELNLAHNEPSLLRSNAARQLSATGIVGCRRASAEGSDLSADGVRLLVEQLWSAAGSAPVDAANAVSAGQQLSLRRGPAEADPAELAAALRALLEWRASQTPTMMIEEASAAHVHRRSHTLTTGGSRLHADLGWNEMAVFGLAREGGQSSSFNYAGGSADRLTGVPGRFGIDRMMRELTQQVRTQALAERFVGDVVLAPSAVGDLVDWLMDQLQDGPLIDGSSVYRQAVGRTVASPLLTLRSRYDAPGCVPMSADAFVTPPVTLVDAGRLTQLCPSLYGSRKTGLPHRPVAGSGWELLAGATPLADIVAAVPRGALVGRLSMGSPAPNGDFSGVIKNSFEIADGRPGAALAETMISGNVARMLEDVVAASAERIDSGRDAWPWLRIGGLHFS
jgi:PmbA protein